MLISFLIIVFKPETIFKPLVKQGIFIAESR